MSEAQRVLGHVDIVINNAGYSGSFQPFTQATAKQISQVSSTGACADLELHWACTISGAGCAGPPGGAVPVLCSSPATCRTRACQHDRLVRTSALLLLLILGEGAPAYWDADVHRYPHLQVVRTNLQGSLLCARAAIPMMQQQEQGGHVFFMDGAGRSNAAREAA